MTVTDALAALEAGGYFVSADAATDSRGAGFLLGWSEQTIRNKRYESARRGEPMLPPHFRCGRGHLFPIGELVEWRARQLRNVAASDVYRSIPSSASQADDLLAAGQRDSLRQ